MITIAKLWRNDVFYFPYCLKNGNSDKNESSLQDLQDSPGFPIISFQEFKDILGGWKKATQTFSLS